MLIKNPKDGAPVKVRVGTDYWGLNPEQVFDFPEDVAKVLLELYGFLEEASPEQAEPAKVVEENGEYKCSKGDFTTKTKVAAYGHIKKHQGEVLKYQKAEPLGKVDLESRGIMARRAVRISGGVPEGIIPGITSYGEGLREERK